MNAARLARLAAPIFALAGAPRAADAQFVQTAEQFYLPASHNWAFRDAYRSGDRLFNAFDYGHAILYETLYTRPGASVERLEEEEYDFIVSDLLVHPPRVPLEEEAIMGKYAQVAPEAKMMFEWAHVLHRQIYDVYADPAVVDKDAAVDELVRYYRSRPDLAFSTVPKSMVLMEGQPYSLAFRRKYPKFNGLIWAYHWLQVGLYEPLVTGRTEEERQKGVAAALARFWSMLEDPPARMPSVMPMTPAVAPEFTRRHADAAAIFDNLHAMHDVISDVLASPEVPHERKRDAILAAAAAYRDDTTEATTREEWLEMARAMGVENMGGPAVAILIPPPQGSPMAGMDHGAGAGEPRAGAAGRAGGMQHGIEAEQGARTEPGGGKTERRPPTDAGPPQREDEPQERHGPGMEHGPETPHGPEMDATGG